MADHDLIIEPAVRLAERDHDRGDGRSSTVISVRSIGRMKMTEPPLQTNKVWAVMLYSNSGDVIGGVRTAPHLFRTREQAIAEAIAWFPDQTFAWQRIDDDFYTAKLPNHTRRGISRPICLMIIDKIAALWY